MIDNIAVIVTYKRLKLFSDLIESISNQDQQFDYVFQKLALILSIF